MDKHNIPDKMDLLQECLANLFVSFENRFVCDLLKGKSIDLQFCTNI